VGSVIADAPTHALCLGAKDRRRAVLARRHGRGLLQVGFRTFELVERCMTRRTSSPADAMRMQRA
jgi:hypothetical protein